MALNTEISWCDHSLNLIWGCVKISQGCKNCYADTLDHRYNGGEKHWGPNSVRKLVRSWKKNLNDMRKSAIKANRRETVFVMSMGDIFEDDQPLSNNHDTPWKTYNDVRQEFFRMIPGYPELIFLLLTKRPENIINTIPSMWVSEGVPSNVWLGCSIVSHDEAVLLMQVMDGVHENCCANMFVSMEPLLGPISMRFSDARWLKWVIVGGESGPKARPMNPDWVRKLRYESDVVEIPFHFKQWGEYLPIESYETVQKACYGSDAEIRKLTFDKVGKHKSGRLLDGIEHINFPKSFHTPLK